MTAKNVLKSIFAATAAGTALYVFSNTTKQTRKKMKRGASMTIDSITNAIDDCRK